MIKKAIVLAILATASCALTAQDNNIDVEEFFANRTEVENEENTRDIDAIENTLEENEFARETPRFFDVPQSGNVGMDLAVQQRLLEQSNELAKLLREIKEEGNEQAVLTLLASITGDESSVVFFQDAFDEVELLAAPMLPALTLTDNASAITPSVPVVPVRRVVHEIIPVFAQVQSTDGGRNKVIVVIDGKRFIRLPGETIQYQGRSILIESISQNIENGREVYNIWIVENGSRNSLTWN
ncbi:MAG: hypothetical protein JKY40_10605 [Gammaproteobacteria bacterium]|nr:hypothetical protein [Gammaproteobacteria bacterium]MBL4729736.1 hypothetical protein [Gammaproteobacteria bacterium]